MAQERHWLGLAAIMGLAGILMACGGAEPDAMAAPAADSREENFGEALRGANILVYSRTAGWRHDSIPAGIAMFDALSAQYEFSVVATEDPTVFSDAQIGSFDAVVFLNTTGDVLNDRQQRAFERYIQSGGGYVGIHAASDTEHDGAWPWYIRLVGGTFASHPGDPSNVQQARLSKAEGADALSAGLPEAFTYVDEWYDFNNLDPATRPILFIDRDSYIGSTASGEERISWFHDYDGGRAFYTNFGHSKETFADELFHRHLLNGLVYAVGDRRRTELLEGRPDPDRFAKDNLVEPLDEPVSLDVLPDGSVLVVERPGRIKRWREGEGVEIVGEKEVYYPGGNSEFGLLALAAVPHDKGPLEGAYVMYNLLDGEQILQRVSYVPFKDDRFDFDDERRLLDIPSDPNCCHTGGAVRFGPDGYLYIAVGDNSNPHELDGLAPLSDEVLAHDARRSAGNTQDLRGKILRIAPSTDGSYEIPEGNLFASAEEGRPEIYVMGARNPYTLGFDEVDGALYFGDIGPDGREDVEAGPRGYDEINRAARAGNFGWPFFIGDNRAYRMSEGADGRPGRLYNPLEPVNDSPRNTGNRTLPPAQPALIWYPYGVSERFPEMGAGGRNALVAGVYRRPAAAGEGAWPSFFEGKLIIGDFMRRDLKAVTIDGSGQAARITPIMEGMEFSGPLDLEFGPDGALYVLEYGTRWFTGNNDARLSRVRYTGSGNRAPRLAIRLDRAAGALPLDISAEAAGAFDPDGDDYQIEWSVAPVPTGASSNGDYAALFGGVVAEGAAASLTVNDPGRHVIIARATDAKGAVTHAYATVDSGNEQPVVSIEVEGNRTFFWPGRDKISYRVTVSDAEDGSSADGGIEEDRIEVRAAAAMTSQPPGDAPTGHLAAAAAAGADPERAAAEAMLAEYTCASCHQVDAASIGPAFVSVAARYASESDARDTLATSLVEGSSGKWGEQAMPPFDFLAPDVRAALIDFILGLDEQGTALPVSGAVAADQFIKEQDQFIRLTAHYTDSGADGAPALSGGDEIHLRSNVVNLASLFQEPGEKDGVRSLSFDGNRLLMISGMGATLPMGEYDLTGVKGVVLEWGHDSQYWAPGKMRIELREGAPDGSVVAAAPLEVAPDKGRQGGALNLAFEKPVDGMRRLFLRVAPMEGVTDETNVAFTQAVFEPRSDEG